MVTSSLQFGKCILKQKTILESLIPYSNLPLEHSPNCHLNGTVKKERNIFYASVGVISDSNVIIL